MLGGAAMPARERVCACDARQGAMLPALRETALCALSRGLLMRALLLSGAESCSRPQKENSQPSTTESLMIYPTDTLLLFAPSTPTQSQAPSINATTHRPGVPRTGAKHQQNLDIFFLVVVQLSLPGQDSTNAASPLLPVTAPPGGAQRLSRTHGLTRTLTPHT